MFIVVSSHGYERPHSSDTDVRCKDGQLISLYDIMTYFDNRNMPALIGIPKVFIFQMCRLPTLQFISRRLHSINRMPSVVIMCRAQRQQCGLRVAQHERARAGPDADAGGGRGLRRPARAARQRRGLRAAPLPAPATDAALLRHTYRALHGARSVPRPYILFN